MCEAMRKLMEDEIADGVRKGRQEGMLDTLCGLVRDGILSIADAAKRAGMDSVDFEKAYETFLL